MNLRATTAHSRRGSLHWTSIRLIYYNRVSFRSYRIRHIIKTKPSQIIKSRSFSKVGQPQIICTEINMIYFYYTYNIYYFIHFLLEWRYYRPYKCNLAARTVRPFIETNQRSLLHVAPTTRIIQPVRIKNVWMLTCSTCHMYTWILLHIEYIFIYRNI